jgi:glutaredoxin
MSCKNQSKQSNQLNQSLDDIISQNDNHVFFFGKEGCKYCNMLKEDMKNMGIPFTLFELGENVDQSVIDEVKERFNYKTFPMLFFGREFMGGYSSFQQLCYTGEIQERLKSQLAIDIKYDF